MATLKTLVWGVGWEMWGAAAAVSLPAREKRRSGTRQEGLDRPPGVAHRVDHVPVLADIAVDISLVLEHRHQAMLGILLLHQILGVLNSVSEEQVSKPADPARGVSGRAEQAEDHAMRMSEIDVQDYARQLLEAHGDKAVSEAAQKACAFEGQGQTEDAETWRHIEAALKLMRGPHVS